MGGTGTPRGHTAALDHLTAAAAANSAGQGAAAAAAAAATAAAARCGRGPRGATRNLCQQSQLCSRRRRSKRRQCDVTGTCTCSTWREQQQQQQCAGASAGPGARGAGADAGPGGGWRLVASQPAHAGGKGMRKAAATGLPWHVCGWVHQGVIEPPHTLCCRFCSRVLSSVCANSSALLRQPNVYGRMRVWCTGAQPHAMRRHRRPMTARLRICTSAPRIPNRCRTACQLVAATPSLPMHGLLGSPVLVRFSLGWYL